MPEGPQVKRVSNMISRFKGKDILEIKHPPSRVPWQLQLPVSIVDATSVGKNIFIELSNGQIIYNHMLMWGRWALGCSPTLGRKRLNTCFKLESECLGYYGGGILKLIGPEEADEIKGKLGPDIIACSSFESAFKLISASDKQIGEALLDQSLVAGVGNIYKSEGLFKSGISPFMPANKVPAQQMKKLYEVLHAQMKKDINTGTIITTSPEEFKNGNRRYVYRRYHQPCIVCGTKIERVSQGRLPRSTYYCPLDQKVTGR